MRLVGIDPSLSRTSLVFRADDATAVARIETAPSAFASSPARLDAMHTLLVQHLRTHKPELAVIEGYAFAVKFVAHSALEWAGLLRLTLWREGVPYIEIPPMTLKKYTTGSGKAEKSMMLRDVYRRWGFIAEHNDDADAFALSQLGVDMVSDTPSALAREIIARTPRVLSSKCTQVVQFVQAVEKTKRARKKPKADPDLLDF